MPRRIAAALPLLLGAAIVARAQAWRSVIDPRVELMSILFRLAGNPEYQQCRAPAYERAIDSYFARERDHEAVLMARSMGVGYEGPMKLAVYLRDTESLAELVPFDLPTVHPYQSWDVAQARDFLARIRQFAAESNYQAFLRWQAPLYSATNARLQTYLAEQCDLGWFAHFYGPPAPTSLVIVPGLANGSSSYAARVIDPNGALEIYAIPGVSQVDAAGLPVFDADWRSALVHQLAHAYGDPAPAHLARMQPPASRIYAAVSDAMQRQSYANWRTMVTQSLARAVAIQYVKEHDGPQAAARVIRQENAHSFFWMSGLVDLLSEYQSNRQQYPTFDSFLPRVADFFDAVAPGIQDLIDRYQPKVVSTSISDGASGVDPSVKSIVVRFSLPMNTAGPMKSASLSGGRFDASGLAVTIPVTLEAEREYAIPVRWAGGQAFVSAEGVPLPPTVLRFHTSAAGAKIP